MHSNIHTEHLIEIINLMCNQNNINEQLKHEISKLSQILIKQNYFQYQDVLYIYIYTRGEPRNQHTKFICLFLIIPTIL
jgi:hypothetical protein